MQNNRAIWLIVLGAVLFFGAALVTLRAAEQASQQADGATPSARASLSLATPPAVARAPASQTALTSPTSTAAPAGATSATTAPRAATTTASKPSHPPASGPEESATITDDPTTAPDPSQSADNNVSFPTDI